jgi:hypothetical protein
MARSPPPGTPTPQIQALLKGEESPPQPPPLDDPCWLLDDQFSLDQGKGVGEYEASVRVDRQRREIGIEYRDCKTRIEINLI